MQANDEDDGGVPRTFGGYLLHGFPRGHNWEPRAPKDSHLRRLYWKMHQSRHDGGTPPLEDDLLEDLDNGVAEEGAWRSRSDFTATWGEVNEIIFAVEDRSPRMGMAIAALELLQVPPKAGRPTLSEWCEENRISDEREVYRLKDAAILAVWLELVKRARRKSRQNPVKNQSVS